MGKAARYTYLYLEEEQEQTAYISREGVFGPITALGCVLDQSHPCSLSLVTVALPPDRSAPPGQRGHGLPRLVTEEVWYKLLQRALTELCAQGPRQSEQPWCSHLKVSVHCSRWLGLAQGSLTRGLFLKAAQQQGRSLQLLIRELDCPIVNIFACF